MNERTRILNLLKDGSITVEEAENLLRALEPETPRQEEQITLKDPRGRKPKKLRVTVDADEMGSRKAKVNINIPISLIKTLGPIIKNGIPNDVRSDLNTQGIDLDAILGSVESLIESGIEEDIVNVDIGDDGEKAKVRIYVE
jgi:hypothetical protein